RGVEDLGDLLQVVDIELPRLLQELFSLPAGSERLGDKQLFQLLRERRLRNAAAAHSQQLDLTIQRRVFAVVQRADDVVCGSEGFVAVELSTGERDKMGGVQSRV